MTKMQKKILDALKVLPEDRRQKLIREIRLVLNRLSCGARKKMR